MKDDFFTLEPYEPPKNRTYEDIKEAARRRAAEASRSGRDIGQIPDCINPERRENARKSLKTFFESYFPDTFYLSWSKPQLETIKRMEASIRKGGNFAIAMPRASGKTVICERAAIWAVLFGYRKFVLIIGATEKATKEMFGAIQRTLETNVELLADFPEVCVPVRAIGGITSRGRAQLCEGQRTMIEWGPGRIILPTIDGYPEIAGNVIESASMTGRLRGMQQTTADGRTIRPDFVIIDDPQTRESARSQEQTNYRRTLITGDILGLAGPGKKMTAVMPCTVIYPGDLADQLLDRQKHPEWNGLRYRLLDGFPVNIDLWRRYREILVKSSQEGKGKEPANAFYVQNRQQMDEGAESTWAARFEEDQISGIQYAMEIYLEDKQKFFAEYQNEPLAEDYGDGAKITQQTIWGKINSRPQTSVPSAATHITMFIDVMAGLLYYTTMAISDDFTATLLEHGTYPEQPLKMFTAANAPRKYDDIFPGNFETRLYSALNALTAEKLGTPYIRDDGAILNIDRCLIDSGWQAETVYRFCRESPFRPVLLPSKGWGINATTTPISEQKRRPGETVSPMQWRKGPLRNDRKTHIITYDTNHWKTFYRNRITAPLGDRNGLDINATDLDEVRLLAEHLSSEYSNTVIASNGRRVDIWHQLPNRENHWLDCVIGCLVAASEKGCAISDTPKPKTAPRTAPPLHRQTGVKQNARTIKNRIL